VIGWGRRCSSFFNTSDLKEIEQRRGGRKRERKEWSCNSVYTGYNKNCVFD